MLARHGSMHSSHTLHTHLSNASVVRPRQHRSQQLYQQPAQQLDQKHNQQHNQQQQLLVQSLCALHSLVTAQTPPPQQHGLQQLQLHHSQYVAQQQQQQQKQKQKHRQHQQHVLLLDAQHMHSQQACRQPPRQPMQLGQQQQQQAHNSAFHLPHVGRRRQQQTFVAAVAPAADLRPAAGPIEGMGTSSSAGSVHSLGQQPQGGEASGSAVSGSSGSSGSSSSNGDGAGQAVSRSNDSSSGPVSSSDSGAGSSDSTSSSRSTGSSSSSSSRSWGSLQRPVRPMLDPQTSQEAVQRRSAQQQQQQQPPDGAVLPQQQPQQQQHLLTWRRQRRALPQQQQQQQAQQQDVQQQDPQQQDPQQQEVQQQNMQQQAQLQEQQQQRARREYQQQQQELELQQQYLTSPVSFVAAHTHPKRLAGSLAACFALHSHQLLFASGTLAVASALKGLATARGMVTGPEAGAEPAYNILVQPTIRSRAAGGTSYALDIAKVNTLPLPPEGTTQDKGPGSANTGRLHITSTSNEYTAARNLVDNMPKRGQTVLRVAGPYAIENALLAVALARPMLIAAWGQDLAVCVMWSANKKFNGSKTGLLLSVYRCAVGSFPPEIQVGPPPGPQEQLAERWQRIANRRRQKWRKWKGGDKQQGTLDIGISG